MVIKGGTSSALISGYTTFLRILSDGRCCGFWVRVGLVRIGDFVFGQEMGHARSGLGEGLVRDGTGRTRPERGVFLGTWTTRPASPPWPGAGWDPPFAQLSGKAHRAEPRAGRASSLFRV